MRLYGEWQDRIHRGQIEKERTEMSIGNILLAAASIMIMVILGILIIIMAVAITWMQVQDERKDGHAHGCVGREQGGAAR